MKKDLMHQQMTDIKRFFFLFILLSTVNLQYCTERSCASKDEYFTNETDSKGYEIIVKYFGCDSIKIIKGNIKQNKDLIITTLIRDKNSYFEIIKVKDFNGKLLGTETRLLLCKTVNDTNYSYQFDLSKYPLTIPYGSEDFVFNIKKKSANEFTTIKTNMRDTLFKEEYYYDKNFRIKKIVINNYSFNIVQK